VILDELLTALYFELVPLADVLHLLAGKPAHVELVVTGRRAPDEVVAAADLVTRCAPSSTTTTPVCRRARASSTRNGAPSGRPGVS